MVETCSVDGCDTPKFVRGYCYTHYHRWHRLGDPLAPLSRNSPNTLALDRFRSFVAMGDPDACWSWQGTIEHTGYGNLALNGRKAKAHRFAYELLVGPIPDGLHIDHLCHTRDLSCAGGHNCPHRRCVNPRHLEPTTQRTNNLRGRSRSAENAAKTHCKWGHPFDDANTYLRSNGGRCCRKCTAESQRRYNARKRRGRHAPARPMTTGG